SWRASAESPAVRNSGTRGLTPCPLLPCQSLRQLNPCPDRIHNERKLQTKVGHVSIRNLDRHAIGLELLDESFEILHLKPDVINRTPFGGSGSGRAVCRKKIHFIPVEHR